MDCRLAVWVLLCPYLLTARNARCAGRETAAATVPLAVVYDIVLTVISSYHIVIYNASARTSRA
eukprot:6207840-Pleurochrysis_carterae.AAC.1